MLHSLQTARRWLLPHRGSLTGRLPLASYVLSSGRL